MYPVSPRFLASISVSHRVAVRVRVFDTVQFGTAPVGGRVLPLIAGDVRMSSTADVKATAELTVPGDFWGQVQPFGPQVFLERGIDYGDGTQEFAALGWFRIDRAEQEDAPYGPVRLSCVDRIAQLQQNRVLRPYQVPDGTTHRQIFARLVNGNAGGGQSTAGYGMYLADEVPITWTSYNPDAARVYGGHVVEDDAYEYLAKLVDGRGCVLRFDEAGGLVVGPRDGDPAGPVVYAITTGTGGNLVRASRSVSREGVYNVVSAYGSDPAAPTGYQLAYNNDEASPLWWQGQFGVAPRFYASPVIRTSAAADSAAEAVLTRYTGLPSVLALYTVPNPALRPLDRVSATYDPDVAETHVVDEVTIPLVGDAPVQITTRPTNSPPATDLQLDPPGDGVQPFMGGTMTAYDPDTQQNVVEIGGEEFSNLPVSGCCDFGGGGGYDFDAYGGQVLLGYGPAGPMILGPIAQFPSEDPQPPDFAGFGQFGGGSGGYDQLYATPQVRSTFQDVRFGYRPGSDGPTPPVTLTLDPDTQVGDTVVVFQTLSYSLAGNQDPTNRIPAPTGSAVTEWTARTPVLSRLDENSFYGEGSALIVVWTGAVTTGGPSTVIVSVPNPVSESGGGTGLQYQNGLYGIGYVLAGPVTVVAADVWQREQTGPGADEAVAPSVDGARGGLLLACWQSSLIGVSVTPPTVPSSMSGQVSQQLDQGSDEQTYASSAREVLGAGGATGTRTAVFVSDPAYHGAASIVVRGAPR